MCTEQLRKGLLVKGGKASGDLCAKRNGISVLHGGSIAVLRLLGIPQLLQQSAKLVKGERDIRILIGKELSKPEGACAVQRALPLLQLGKILLYVLGGGMRMIVRRCKQIPVHVQKL